MGHSVIQLNWLSVSFLKERKKERMSERTGSGSGSDRTKRSNTSGVEPHESRRRKEENLIGVRRQKRARLRYPTLTAIPKLLQSLCSEYPALESQITSHLNTLLALDDQIPLIDDVLKDVVLPRFVKFLDDEKEPQFQLEALWVLTNFAEASSKHTKVVLEVGVIPRIVSILKYNSEVEILEQAIYALGLIADYSPSYRDRALSNGSLRPLLSLVESLPGSSMLIARTLCSLVQGKPPVNFQRVKNALPVLQKLIHTANEEVVSDACWALYHLSEGPEDQIQAIIEAGVCPKLVELLQHSSVAVISPALQTLGNIVTGDNAQKQIVVDNQVLPGLYQLLMRGNRKSIRIEACLAISNITSGNEAQIEAVLKANIIPQLVQILQQDELDIKSEAAWAIYNATAGGSHDNIRLLADQGCIKALCDILTCPDLTVVSVSLEGLENILKVVGEAAKEMVCGCEGLDKIQNLLTLTMECDENEDDENEDENEHEEKLEVFEIAHRILKTFWPELGLEENELENPLDGSLPFEVTNT
ncbi:hypothetical protein GLYMA_19G227200v4 [Glycine max]|nr:hypothetical protein GLYMA_19G227200v4 [Glycine max]|eukprot:XP_003553700.3 importin subunit alpha-4 [Glycine max]